MARSAIPISNDPISDNPNGVAAFSSRGPTDDGRIKPEIVAPGTNIISTRSHMPNASYSAIYNDDYVYDSGTSMATPMVSGMAALVRQWLNEERGMAAPSAALVKALLLNGAAAYGAGPVWQRCAARDPCGLAEQCGGLGPRRHR